MIPEGFEPLFRTSPFLDLVGPLYQMSTESGLLIGFEVQDKHCNGRETLHGGMISTIADVALGYNTAFHEGDILPVVTTHLDTSYLGSVKKGEWVSVETRVSKRGQRNAFAACEFKVGDKVVAQSKAVFTVVSSKP